MKQFILISMVALLCTGLPFVDNRNLDLPTGVSKLLYSNDQQYLFALTQTPVGVHFFNGFTGRQLGQFTIPDDFVPQSVAVSLDSTLVALGSRSGDVKVFINDNGTFDDTTKELVDVSTSTINAVAFSPDNQYIVVGIFDGDILLWDWNNNPDAVRGAFGISVFGAAWSPVQNDVFVVGGGSGTADQIVVYQMDSQGTGFAPKDPQPAAVGQVATDLKYSADGQKLYRVGNGPNLYIYNTADMTAEQTIDTGFSALQEVKVSKDGKVIATVNAQKTVCIQISDDLTATTIESFDSQVDTVALSPEGGQLIVMQAPTAAVIKGQCQEGKYLRNGTCEDCDSSCTLCFSDSAVCQECQNRFYLENQACLDCVDGCQECTDGSTCDTCRTADDFIKQDDICRCIDGKYDEQNNCADCIDGCQYCNASTGCDVCWAAKGYKKQGELCVCDDRFFPDAGTCAACKKGCFSCDNDQQCTKCDTQNHFVGDDATCACDGDNFWVADAQGDCVCMDGYFAENDACSKCPVGCTTCTSATECGDCEAGFEKRDNVCKCPIGQYVEDGTCANCGDEMTACVECDVADTCLRCQDGLNRELINGQCQCEDTYFQDESKNCEPCNIDGCLDCVDTTQCITCNEHQGWIINATSLLCECNDRWVAVGDVCQPCPVGCFTCSDNVTCEVCDAEYHFVDDGAGGCICDSWYYFDNSTDTCQVCMAGCKECNDGDTCDICDTDDHFEPMGMGCRCINTYYLNDRNCSICSSAIQNCQECSDGSTCTKCSDPFMTHSDRCYCEEGKWVDDHTCSDCPEECTKCDNMEHCTECHDGYQEEEGVCKSDGLGTLIIVMIVVGVLALFGAGFAIYKCIMKKKRSALEEEGYENLDSA